MTLEEAHHIASARLGPALHHVTRGGATADEWLVQAVPPSGPLLSVCAAGLEEAIGAAEAQLRAAGWSPSHAWLEWVREFDDFSLVFHYDALTTKLWSGKVYSNGTGWAFNDSTGNLYNDVPVTEAKIVGIITEWCATNLPSLHLPPFPETPHD